MESTFNAPPAQQTYEVIEEQIKLALINSLSLNEQLRNQSLDFLTKQCEPNPEMQLALLNIIGKNHFIAGSSNQEEASMLQYQAIMFMKNSLNRLFQAHRNKKLFKHNAPQLTDSLKESIKAQLLALIQAPDGIIHMEKSYEQLTLVAAIFVHYDFPANWSELNQWLLSMFDQLHQSLPTLSIEQVPSIKRFLKFYLEVMTAQNKKKLNPSKGQFHKVAREHLKAVKQVWTFFNTQQMSMIYNSETSQLTLDQFNQDLFELASKLDKCLQLVIACGFSLADLLTEPNDNRFIQTTQQLIEKIQFYTNCVDKISQLTPQNAVIQKFYELFQKQIKALLKLTTDLQYAEPLIIFDSLGLYIETLAHILFKGNLHNDRVKKLALFALYRVINMDIYNSIEKQNYSDGIGLLVSPSKFKNFEPQLLEAKSQYQFILDKPDLTSKDTRALNRKDGAREILKLVFQFYLPISENIQSWQTDPESFIELEDENYFISEFDLDSACSINFLAHQLTERLICQMYNTCYPFIKDDLLTQYFNGALPLSNEYIEDALMSIVGMLAKIQQKLPAEKRLDILFVLDFLKQNKFQNPLFKRRYTHLLTQWAKIIPKNKLMDYFRILIQSLQEVTDKVLIYEHCRCIHEIIKEIDYWIKKSESGSKPSYAIGSLFDYGSSPVGEEEDQIQMSIQINRQIDYTQLFSLVASKIIPILGVFQAPTLIWNMINYLTLLLEKNSDSQSLMTECFRTLNLHHLLSIDQKLIDEAILDMLKNLFALQPTSSVILEMCISVLDFKLSKKPDAMVIQFWLFTTRAVSADNASIGNLKPLFQKYSWYADVKKDYMVIDFLKILQEYVLLDLFTSQEELTSLIQYMHQKFIHEIQVEALQIKKNESQSTANQDDSSSDEPVDANIYEKKLNILVIAHLILQKGQANPPEVLQIVLVTLKDFLITLCGYFYDFKAQKNVPSSSLFYTQAVTFINRAMIVNRDFFLSQILEPMLASKGITFAQFVEAWFNKMELIVSQESRRINLLALYTLLPFFSGDLLQKSFGEIGRMTFTILESHISIKILNTGGRYCSPTKIGGHYNNIVSTKVKINMFEKISQRSEHLKKEDPLLDIDIIDYFWQRLEETQKQLNIQPNIQVLGQFIADENIRQMFANLIIAGPTGNGAPIQPSQQLYM